MSLPLPIVNLATATFECVFGRGCDGICCREGEPPIEPDEIEFLKRHLSRILPLVRPEARSQIESSGFLGDRHSSGRPKLAVNDGWCVFFNAGCVLHKLGAAEGDPHRYKPRICSIFPLDENEAGQWYVRQWGAEGEEWDLFCLNPAHSRKLAAESLQAEIALLRKRLEADANPPTLSFPAGPRARESA
jgi:Fe-S-cluster containining protein